MKFFLYTRKSSEDKDKQIKSIPDQENWGRSEAAKRGGEIVKVFHETKTARRPGRNDFNEMMEGLECGDADGIITWKLDRLARNPIDGGQVIWLTQSNVIKKIVTSDKDWHPNDNMLMMAVEFGMANQYSIELGKNVKRRLKEKVTEGWFPGKAPKGYKNVGVEGDKYIDVGDDWHIISHLWKLGLTGQHSLKKLCKEALLLGYKISPSSLLDVFNNPFYAGHFYYKGELYKGKQPVMVTWSEYEHMQSVMNNKGRARGSKKFFSFTGFIACGECGHAITAEEKKKLIKSTNEVRFYTYYHCSKRSKTIKCSQPSIEQKELYKQMQDFLETLTIPNDFVQFIIDHLHEVAGEEIQDRQTTQKMYQKQLTKCTESLDELVRMRLKHLLTDEEYLAQKNVFTLEKASLEEKIATLSTRQDNWMDQTDKAFSFMKGIRERFENGDMIEKRSIISAVGSNLVLKDRKLDISPNGVFVPLQKACLETQSILAEFEPSKGLNFATKTVQESIFKVWLRGSGSNRRPIG